ncbi:MAG: CoA pyrophosphatase [Bacteroidales bacterium]|nr:CoA pyrophosphatase [Bacteroidales bacterium]
MKITLPDTLPGKEAHLMMAPEPRVITLIKELTPPSDAKESAVLILLSPPQKEDREESQKAQYLHEDEILNWELLFIKRNTYDGVHSGQIAFPGGKCEKGDPDYTYTACREAYEELGVDRTKIEIAGELTKLYVPPSNFTIYPVVAINRGFCNYSPNPREVAEYIHIPLKYFDPLLSKRCKVQAGPYEWVHAPGYVINGHTIWGATAMIIAELYVALSQSTIRNSSL